MQKDSIFLSISIICDSKAIQESSYFSDFLLRLNKILHDDNEKVDEEIQREIFKVMVVVTLRQIILPLTKSFHVEDHHEGQYASMSIVANGVTKVVENHIKSLGNNDEKTII